VVLLGASTDSPKAQKKFIEAQQLPFPLLADEKQEVVKSYGVLKEKNMYGRKVMGVERTTVIIGPDGRIQRIFPKVKPEGHAQQILEALRDASGKRD
jgi:peroxiredoxin Q/BCP